MFKPIYKNKVLNELRQQFDLERIRKELVDQKDKDNIVKVLNNRITDLEAQLKIAKAEALQAYDKAKAEYANHVMQVTDDRVKEMRSVYENYAKTLVEVVTASVKAPVLIPTSTTNNNSTKA